MSKHGQRLVSFRDLGRKDALADCEQRWSAHPYLREYRAGYRAGYAERCKAEGAGLRGWLKRLFRRRT